MFSTNQKVVGLILSSSIPRAEVLGDALVYWLIWYFL